MPPISNQNICSQLTVIKFLFNHRHLGQINTFHTMSLKYQFRQLQVSKKFSMYHTLGQNRNFWSFEMVQWLNSASLQGVRGLRGWGVFRDVKIHKQFFRPYRILGGGKEWQTSMSHAPVSPPSLSLSFPLPFLLPRWNLTWLYYRHACCILGSDPRQTLRFIKLLNSFNCNDNCFDPST